jgi:hypothetical protein
MKYAPDMKLVDTEVMREEKEAGSRRAIILIIIQLVWRE